MFVESFDENTHLDRLTLMIVTAKAVLSSYVKMIDDEYDGNYNKSRLASSRYLSLISDLAKAYQDFDLDKDAEQIINFFTISDTVVSIRKGLSVEAIINSTRDNLVLESNRAYSRTLEELSSPSNFPMSQGEYRRKLAWASEQLTALEAESKMESDGLMKEIFPVELMDRKPSQPYIDKDGNQYSSILEFIGRQQSHDSKFDTSIKSESSANDISLSDSKADNETKIHM